MGKVQYMSKLDTPAKMLTVIKKLPYKLKGKWRMVAYDSQEMHHHRAVFVLTLWISLFLIQCYIQDTVLQNQFEREFLFLSHIQNKGNTFRTTVISLDEKENRTKERGDMEK